jgi:hypothetical protein
MENHYEKNIFNQYSNVQNTITSCIKKKLHYVLQIILELLLIVH